MLTNAPVKHSCSGSSAALTSLKPGLMVITCCPALRSRCRAKLTVLSLPLLTLSAMPPGWKT